MKHLLIAFLLFMTISSINAQSIDGFFGMKFGSSVDSIKKAMLSKQGSTIESKFCTDSRLVFTGLKFAGRNALLMRFSFVNNKFHTGTAAFTSDLESKVVDLYNDIKGEINEKYHQSTSDYEQYKYPYEKGDGHTETAIKLGKASFATYWFFKHPISGNKDYQNSITLEISSNLTISITYQDGMLINEAIEKKKEKNFKDY
jgi:hypothetical protein